MKNILVIYYSQSGQLNDITSAMLKPIQDLPDFSIDHFEIKPRTTYPFPWTATSFFDTFPESVLGETCDLNNSDDLIVSRNYDLIILAYQIWYLSPSIPVHSFLKDEKFAKVFNGKPVITIIGCRNMWIMAQEKVKGLINTAGGKLVGNIVFEDKAPNLVSVITILRWMLKGKKNRFLKIFPPAGVSSKDIEESVNFGRIIAAELKKEKFGIVQEQLNNLGAIRIKPNLLILEKRGSKTFKIWAKWIRNKGEAGNPARRARLKIFMFCLPTAILILSPITTLISNIIPLLFKNKMKRQLEYYSGVSMQ